MAGRGNNRATEDVLDAQNREYHERLSNKTSYLKGLAYDMEMEARNRYYETPFRLKTLRTNFYPQNLDNFPSKDYNKRTIILGCLGVLKP
jgi:hypothetical protein